MLFEDQLDNQHEDHDMSNQLMKKGYFGSAN